MSTHTSTKGKRGGHIVLPDDHPSLVRFADLLQLRSLAYSTRAEYLRYLRRLGARAGVDPATLSEEQVRAHILQLKTAHAYSPSSMRTAVAALSAFYNLHLGNAWKLFGLVRSPDRQTLPTVLTRTQLAALFAAVREERFLMLFRTIYACGLRVSEAVNLRVTDIEADGKRWMKGRSPEFLLPVKAVAAAFRDGFEEALRAELPGWHAAVPERTWREAWNVDVQPAGTGVEVVRYLARYVKRSAIADERIIEADDEAVRFRYTDSQTGERREATLSAAEFMRRYLLHVPAPGRHRVRYFGWLHPAAWRRRLKVETLLAKVIVVRAKPAERPDWSRCCPHCGKFALVFVGLLPRGPPLCR